MVGASERDLRKVRGNDISFIFQEPMTSLNPLHTIEKQMAESLALHQGLTGAAARARIVELLTKVGIREAESRLGAYPHQLSGGQRQRVMIAMALANGPELLVADEPTTALDVTIQAQILDLMLEVKKKTKDAAILLITHDLAVVAETCQRVAVMYGGRIQEISDVKPLFDEPLHPYTRGLLKSLPGFKNEPGKPLPVIEGMVPDILSFPKGCKFNNRCPEVMPECRETEPELVEVAPGRQVRCHKWPKKQP